MTLSFSPRRRDPLPSAVKKDDGLSRVRLPQEYLENVAALFEKEFSQELAHLQSFKQGLHFEGEGFLYPDEITLTLSLVQPHSIQAISFHASCDYQPPSPLSTSGKEPSSSLHASTQEILGACVDALDAFLLVQLKTAEKRTRLCEQPLTLIDDLPLHWISYPIRQHPVFIQADNTHPGLEKMTEEWLSRVPLKG